MSRSQDARGTRGNTIPTETRNHGSNRNHNSVAHGSARQPSNTQEAPLEEGANPSQPILRPTPDGPLAGFLDANGDLLPLPNVVLDANGEFLPLPNVGRHAATRRPKPPDASTFMRPPRQTRDLRTTLANLSPLQPLTRPTVNPVPSASPNPAGVANTGLRQQPSRAQGLDSSSSSDDFDLQRATQGRESPQPREPLAASFLASLGPPPEPARTRVSSARAKKANMNPPEKKDHSISSSSTEADKTPDSSTRERSSKSEAAAAAGKVSKMDSSSPLSSAKSIATPAKSKERITSAKGKGKGKLLSKKDSSSSSTLSRPPSLKSPLESRGVAKPKRTSMRSKAAVANPKAKAAPKPKAKAAPPKSKPTPKTKPAPKSKATTRSKAKPNPKSKPPPTGVNKSKKAPTSTSKQPAAASHSTHALSNRPLPPHHPTLSTAASTRARTLARDGTTHPPLSSDVFAELDLFESRRRATMRAAAAVRASEAETEVRRRAAAMRDETRRVMPGAWEG